jgi:hypothetical protein
MEGLFVKYNDKEYLRVTDILYPFSGLKDIDQEILKNAADRGTVVHKICDSILLGHGTIGLEELVQEYCRNPEHVVKEKEKVEFLVKSFEKWFVGKDFLKKPERFYDDDLLLTGECDLVYNDNGKTVLVDLKTPVKESKSWLLQGSAYSYLSKKEKYHIDRIEFIQLSRTGGKAKVFTYEENFPLFLSVLNTYKYFYSEPIKENPMDYL